MCIMRIHKINWVYIFIVCENVISGRSAFFFRFVLSSQVYIMFFPSTREKYRVVVGVRRRIGVPRRVFTSQYITHLADLHTRLIIIKCPKKKKNNKIYYIHPSEIPSSKVRRASFACHYCLFWPFFFCTSFSQTITVTKFIDYRKVI